MTITFRMGRMTESPDALPPDWERDRGFLLVLARLRVPPWLRAKVDAADVVQQALLQAHARREQLLARDDRWVAQVLRPQGRLLKP
jgi:hypothetical protein